MSFHTVARFVSGLPLAMGPCGAGPLNRVLLMDDTMWLPGDRGRLPTLACGIERAGRLTNLHADPTKTVAVHGVGSTPEPELGGEAGLRGVEAPEGSEEPVARGPANQGVGVVQVLDVDAEEVGEPDERGRGNANTPFGNLAEEVGKGGEGPAGGGTLWLRRP